MNVPEPVQAQAVVNIDNRVALELVFNHWSGGSQMTLPLTDRSNFNES
jgi:hypothetical protein